MEVDYLVIGQGICGSLLTHELQKAGRSCFIIDDNRPFVASRVASGIINPVTGRRIVKSWMIDDLVPVAQAVYREAGEMLGVEGLAATDIVDFFPTPQMRLAFLHRLSEDPAYLSMPADENDHLDQFAYTFGYGRISPVLLVNLSGLLPAFRNRFIAQQVLRPESFDQTRLVVAADHVRYDDITAGKIIFCDGINSGGSSWFKTLPFAPNKGEALLVDIPGLVSASLYKKGITLVPWKEGLWWVGSSHQWQFDTDQPTEAFRLQTEAQLKQFCKIPFTVVDHWAAVRPATLERRPFVGLHPAHPAIGIFNGMGTKGCSLAPFFARQLADHLTQKIPLLPEVDICRFQGILSRHLF